MLCDRLRREISHIGWRTVGNCGNEPLGAGDRTGSGGQYFADVAVHGSVERRLRRDGVDETELPGPRSRKPSGGQKELTRGGDADLSHRKRRDHRRKNAEFGFGEPEYRVVGGDHDVAYRRETCAAAER